MQHEPLHRKKAQTASGFAFPYKHSLAVVGSLLMAATCMVAEAEAVDFSFRGTFSADDDVQLFNFTVSSPSNVTLKTLSYAGGTQADGTVISRGGFDPILALFDGSGNFIDNNDDGSFPNVDIDPVTNVTYDTFLQLSLAPGNYTVAVSQFNNFFNGTFGDNISLGFSQEGNPTFTSVYGCSAGQFCDFTGDSRTNEWAFDVLNVDSASAVPEPLTMLGAGTALGFGSFFKRKLSKNKKK